MTSHRMNLVELDEHRVAVAGMPLREQVLLRVRLRARCRAAWLRKLWSEEEAPGGDATITEGEVDTHLLARDNPADEAAWTAKQPELQRILGDLDELEHAMMNDPESRLNRLSRTLGLSDAESDVLQACLALDWDRSFSRVYAYLQDNASRGYVTESLAARLFLRGTGRLLDPSSPLLRWLVVGYEPADPGLEPVLVVDPHIRAWLDGHDTLRVPGLVPTSSTPLMDALPLEGWPIIQTVETIGRWRSAGTNRSIAIRVAGPPGSGRQTFATLVCQAMGFPLAVFDASAVPDDEWRSTVVRCTRHALLTGGALVWRVVGSSKRPWPAVPEPCSLQFFVTETASDVELAQPAIHHAVELHGPSLTERRSLWTLLVGQAAFWPEGESDQLARSFRAGPGEIADVAAHLPADPQEAAAVLRRAQRGRLGDLAELIETPFTLDDLIVHDHVRLALEDLIFEAEHRGAFWERSEARRLFPQGKGLVALFNGPPGAGKTMAAQVVAASLGFDLFRVDLSNVVSKYVGETSENLARLLSRAAAMDAVMLFDEADALFGKRTEVQDAHDRYANTDTGHLLQAIESYPGIALLATNKKSNVDPAFTRRLRYVIDFSKPDAAQRAELWRRVIEELVGSDGVARLGVGLTAIANGIEATGAEIKYAVLTACFAAEREGTSVEIRHLVRGLDRELMKSGKGISDRDREMLAAHG